MARSWDDGRTDEFTGAPCRPLDAGQTARVVTLPCPNCQKHRPDTLPTQPFQIGGTGHWWKDGRFVPYVAVATSGAEASAHLLDHLTRVHPEKWQ